MSVTANVNPNTVVLNEIMKDLTYSVIRYNYNEYFPNEILFLNVGYDGGSLVYGVNKGSWKFEIEDYNLGHIIVYNNDVDNSNFSHIVNETLSKFGSSFKLEYLRPLSKIKLDGTETRVNNEEMIELIKRLIKAVNSYIASTFPTQLSVNSGLVRAYYTYLYRTPTVNEYGVLTNDYVYSVSHNSRVLSVYRKIDDELKEVFSIDGISYRYSKSIESKIIKLVVQSKVKSYEYMIDINDNVKINDKVVNVDDELAKGVKELVMNKINYEINRSLGLIRSVA